MSWLQTHEIAVPTYQTTTTATHGGRKRMNLTLFQITLTSRNAHAAVVSIDRPMVAFQSLRTELLRLTRPQAAHSKKTEWMRRIVKTKSTRSPCCSCEKPSPCSFQKLHDTIQTMEPLSESISSSRFQRTKNHSADVNAQRLALESWLQCLHRAFASFSGSLLQAKYQRSNCDVLNAYASFFNAKIHFRVLDAATLRQPLALRAWRAEREQAAVEDLSLVDDDDEEEQDATTTTATTTIQSAATVEDSHRLPRLEVKRVGLATLQTFLEDFCETILTQYGQDITELQSPELTMSRRWEICLYVACRIGHSYGAQLILFYYADANVAMEDGTTCLHIASRMGRTAIVSMLLQEGADVNQANKSGITPLIAACRNGCVEVAKTLLEAGANVCAASAKGTHPLHAAIVSQSIEIVELLLANGANVRATTASGLTPLHFAAKLGSVELTELLLKHNADPEQQTKSGSDAIAIATTNGHFEICELFQKEMDRKNVLTSSGGKLFHRFKKQQQGSASGRASVAMNLRSSTSHRLSLEENNTVILRSRSERFSGPLLMEALST